MMHAAQIVPRLGGTVKVADALGVHRTRVWNWGRPRELGGTGGRIPLNHHRKLIELAKDAGLELSAEDLLPLTDETKRLG